ncbi:MAG: DUF4249 domain-containing protein [Chitinophagaceae bacterium]
MRYHVSYTIPVVTFSCLAVFCTCKQRYEPPVLTINPNYLVVDGFLNNGPDSTFIRLSRARKLDSNLVNSGEKNAELYIEDVQGNVLYSFKELNDDGLYTVPGMVLDSNTRYRLRIKTVNGKQYLSDEMAVQQSPKIDSINWKRDETGVTIYANTHDASNRTKYYRWDYTETWQYHSAYVAEYTYVDFGILEETPPNYYECWKTQVSKTLFLASSDRLAEDIIYENPLRFIPINSLELTIRYSIIVQQYALTKEAYQYLEKLRKNTEQTGSIFDAQPSELTGNIHAVNGSTEPVLGFMTVCTKDSKRIFITQQEVDPWHYTYKCGETKYSKNEKPWVIASIFGSNGDNLPIADAPSTIPFTDSIWGAPKACVNCTLLGGVTKRPDFW